ncbi:MAG: SCO6745 family protein [Acidimicrobiales bacterium]
MTDPTTPTRPTRSARVLAGALEPFAGQVYFSPECHEAYAQLGFAASPITLKGVAMPDGAAYFCSRGSVLGQVPGEVVAAAFAVFNPAVVVPAVAFGWSLTDAATIESRRSEGAVAQLVRILGDAPEGVERSAALLERAGRDLAVAGKPLYAGLMAQPAAPGTLGAAWRYADRLREYRGDAHIAAWTAAGFDAVEIGLLTEPYWGVPARSYIRTRAWSDDDLDEAQRRLASRGLLDSGQLSPEGRSRREEVEIATDLQCSPILDNLGDDFEELVGTLDDWGAAIRAAGGYPAEGPHDLATANQGRD